MSMTRVFSRGPDPRGIPDPRMIGDPRSPTPCPRGPVGDEHFSSIFLSFSLNFLKYQVNKAKFFALKVSEKSLGATLVSYQKI